MNKLTILISIVAAACLGGAAYLAIEKSRRGAPSIVAESEAERDESVRAAFSPSADGSHGTAITDDPELHAEMKTFFEELGTAFSSGDKNEISRYFSMEALLAYCEASGLIDLSKIERRKRPKFRRDFVGGMKTGFANSAPASSFTNPRIMRIEKIRDGELIVYIRAHLKAFEIGIKQRWWLIKNSDGEWQAYDHEDVEQPLRVSALLGAAVAPGGSPPAWSADFLALAKAIQGLADSGAEGVLEQIDEATKKMLKHKMPKDIEGFVLTLRAGILLENGETGEEVAKLFERIDTVSPGAPGTLYMRGQMHSVDGEFEEAIEQFDKYVKILGWDAEVHEALADCYLQIDEIETSIEHAEKGLADTPSSAGCLSSLAVALPADRRGELIRHFDNMVDKEGAYETTIDYAIQLELDEVRDHVLAMLKKDFPDSGLVEYYEEEIEAEKSEPVPEL